MTGIDIRHRGHCDAPRLDGRCCGAGWQAHVFDKRTGRRLRKTFASRTEAKQWRQDALVALRLGTMTSATRTTVTGAAEALVAGMRDQTVLDRTGKPYKPATVRSYEQALSAYVLPALGSRRLSDVQRRDVQDMIDGWRASGLAPGTVANKLDPLRVVYRRAIQRDEVAVDPTKNLELPANRGRRERIASPERAAALIAALPAGERALWACAFYAGLRVGELRALRWLGVDFEHGVIRVEAGWDDHDGEQDPKTYAGRRTVPLAGRLRAELAAHKLATGRRRGDLVFGRTASAAFTRSTIRSRALRAWEAADPTLEPLTPHEARHTCASYLIAAGVNAKELSVFMGHSSVKTTFDIYGHLLPGGEQEAVLKLDRLLGDPASAATLLRQSAPDSSGFERGRAG